MEKGSSSSSAGLDSLNGLKFGKKIYFEGVGSGLHPKAGGVPPPAAALPPSPAKKGRTSGVQPPRCVVDGCKVDLSNAKAYYSRHKVCSMHSKSPKVTVAGHEQRFCQQCSRFHQLPEFDQGKRSCRRRLAGHNERRRKPPPPPPLGSLRSPRYACFSPSFLDCGSRAGGFVMDFSAYPALSGRDSWPSDRGPPGNQASIPGKYHLPPEGSSQNPLPHLLPRPTYSSSDGCFNQVSDSCNALSLLSTQPWASRTRSTTLGATNFLGTNGTAMINQPSLTPAQFAFNQPHDALHGMPHLGLGQAPFIGDLGLAQPNDGHFHELDHSRGFDTSLQHMHWSL